MSSNSSNIGIPIKLLYEAESMKVTVEMKNGETYRGLLLSAEETMNMSLSEVVKTARNGQVSKLPNIYLRGGSIRLVALPDLLRNAPVFKKVVNMKKKAEQAAAASRGATSSSSGGGGGGGVKRKHE